MGRGRREREVGGWRGMGVRDSGEGGNGEEGVGYGRGECWEGSVEEYGERSWEGKCGKLTRTVCVVFAPYCHLQTVAMEELDKMAKLYRELEASREVLSRDMASLRGQLEEEKTRVQELDVSRGEVGVLGGRWVY